jgi:osmotically-inducible protein OsmY
VTLLGNVDTYWEKWAAEDAIKRVAGVRTVALDLAVNVLEHHKRNDSDIAAAVQRALEWNVAVPASVTAEVRNGSVTLSGQVTWNYQRDAAVQSIRAMKGVVGVTNLIGLEKLNVPAEQVQAKLEAALLRRATGEANSIHADTSGGKVTLSGKAASWRSMEDAEDAAWATPGVTLVVDRVQIAMNP